MSLDGYTFLTFLGKNYGFMNVRFPPQMSALDRRHFYVEKDGPPIKAFPMATPASPVSDDETPGAPGPVDVSFGMGTTTQGSDGNLLLPQLAIDDGSASSSSKPPLQHVQGTNKAQSPGPQRKTIELTLN